MPQLQGVRTIGSEKKWSSPDGSRTIWAVVLDYQGKQLKAETWSKDIAVTGWTGDIETYEKEGKYGLQTFVKQPQREGFTRGGGQGGRPSYQPKDEAAIKAMWAIGQSVSAHDSSDAMNVADLESIRGYAIELFNMVEVVKQSVSQTPRYEATADEQLSATMDETLEQEPLDLSEIDTIFPGTSKINEKPWKKS